MFERIHIRKKGLFYKSGKLRIIDRPLAFYMRHVPVFEKGLTVLDLMQTLERHENELDVAFLSYTRGFLFRRFYDEVISDPKADEEVPIDFLEFSWAVDVHNFNEFEKPNYEISEYIHISGKKPNDKQNYGISLTNLSSLAKARIKLNKKIEYSHFVHGELWEDKKIAKKTFLKGEKEFTFENIIGAFLTEVSFFGYPEDREEQFSELSNRDIDSEKLIPFEKIQLDWKIKELASWQNKKDGKTKALKIEKLEKEIEFLSKKLEELE